ncbi:DUF159-domain-containing protein [Lophiostoma macrostomum CBS 122681]|uniref:DUF159-domain-containing protein n=1 Tax=Lophiostoma macrostomum CBS 122681 TaxID=1314788 RepID=A0A6A6TJJ6_9PLEO|nr:DUF159-domain-containing protein [Lophiostoma macrostomum CBS 122681]
MCGRYALALRPSEVRHQLEQLHMPVNEAPDDEGVRQTYNFAPGYHGLVYRADEAHNGTQYKLQAMRWGLIPFWTKRNPDYGSMIKTINCRDDSLYEDRGMWTSMKKRKRCIVVAQGFYEWLKKNNGKEKIPHFTKRKDGQMMCFAGLWDCVQYEADSEEKIFTYTIITTDSNKQLHFLHDRMPVILENGTEAITTWLDPNRTEWSMDLQSLLKPFEGELECYPVTKDVGKVGNNSPSFLIPINSAANKNNIANFFGNQRNASKTKKDEALLGGVEQDSQKGLKTEHDDNETRETTNRVEGSEDNAPLPVPALLPSSTGHDSRGVKRERSEEEDGNTADGSPSKTPAKKGKTRSAVSNGSAARGSPAKGDGSRKITSFFGK